MTLLKYHTCSKTTDLTPNKNKVVLCFVIHVTVAFSSSFSSRCIPFQSWEYKNGGL